MTKKFALTLTIAIGVLTGCNPTEHYSIPTETKLNYDPVIVRMPYMTGIIITPEPQENTITAVEVTQGLGNALIQNNSIQFVPHSRFHGIAKLVYRTIISGVPTDRFIYVHVIKDEADENLDENSNIPKGPALTAVINTINGDKK